MPKISRNLSVSLSLAISILFMAIILAGYLIMPTLVPMLIDIPDQLGNRDAITLAERSAIFFLTYAILLALTVTDGLLFSLLLKVKKGQVFTPVVVSRIRGISWCCYLLCVLFAGLGIWFQLSFIVSFAAAFLGLCLRVVKNVMEEATQIKQENDLTV